MIRMICPFILILLLSLSLSIEGRRSEQDLRWCHRDNCTSQMFQCGCESEDFLHRACIPLSWTCDGWKDCNDGSDEIDCVCGDDSFQCGCDHGGGCSSIDHNYYCISEVKRCDNKVDCLSARDELSCKETDLHRCLSGEYIEHAWVCDGWLDCFDEYSDEINCTFCPDNLPHRCECNKINNMTCKGSNFYTCYNNRDECDGIRTCSDNSDEHNCYKCPSRFPHRCHCNQPTNNTCEGYFSCFSDQDKCDGVSLCSDDSDEQGCPYACSDDEFVCSCRQNIPPTCSTRQGCISKPEFYKGKITCPNENYQSDFYTTMTCGSCRLIVFRLANIEKCNEIGFPLCDNSTCYYIPNVKCLSKNCTDKDLLCSSYCSSLIAKCIPFECEDGTIISPERFCNFQPNCNDKSDEIRTQYGFKCSINDNCILPQIFLNDSFPHCSNEADLCGKSGNCFECYDKKHIINQNQVCDGVMNCYDLSDECLCKSTIHSELCKIKFIPNDHLSLRTDTVINPCKSISVSSDIETNCTLNETVAAKDSKMSCETKWGSVIPTLCDGRPECRDFSDECTNECGNHPLFCNDTCHSFYPLGDRYCDGQNDYAWKVINNSVACPEGFDEINCPKRFKCLAGELVSVDISKVCDGKRNCNDGEDESDCDNFIKPKKKFSSDTEMIASAPLKAVIWIIGFFAIIGNTWALYLVARTLMYAPTDMSPIMKHTNILLLNLSFSDLIMGIYLITIAVKSVIYSGNYSQFDFEWRSSISCSVIGSLQLISSETSCFLMLIISTFRLHNIRDPFATNTDFNIKWKICISFSWICSFLLSFLPIISETSNYFTYAVWRADITSNSTVWDKDSTITFTLRLANLTNKTIVNKGNAWKSTKDFLQNEFPEYSVKGEFGYYGETSVCMPRFYVKHGDNAWEYSVTLMTINFIAFFWIMICYIWLNTITVNHPISTLNDKTNKQNKKLQRMIASLIITDFLCWMPICIMAYLKLAGVDFSMEVYIISAIVVLPINSAMNPLLYTNIPKVIFKKFFFKTKKNKVIDIPMQ